MKIESSVMSLASASAQTKTHSVTEELNAWVDTQQERSPSTDGDGLFGVFDQAAVYSSGEGEEITFEISQQDRDKLTLLSKIIEALTGKKMRFYIPEKIKLSTGRDYAYVKLQNAQQAARRRGWGLTYRRREIIEETARMDFRAQGIVQTSDGKTIRLNLDMSLSRSFVSEDNLTIQAGDALIDPIVVNFNTPSAELTAEKYGFDIDRDGREENISFVQSGSGFLVFDRNEDGKINDGSELFGPSTGNGFMELSALDSDGNGWIDENDPIYDRLQIWTKDEEGNDRLFAIGQKGIGAIYLGSVESAFELKDTANALLGRIGSTGVFLREDGTPGTLQHVDLSV